MLATFAALNDIAVEVRKVEEETKAVVECCEEVESCPSTLQEEHAKMVDHYRSKEEELKAREAKLGARERELSRKTNHVGAEHEHLVEREKDSTTKEALIDAREKALAAPEEKKASELALFPDVELGLRKAIRYLCRGWFDEPLATPEEGFAVPVNGFVTTLEAAVTQMEKTLERECRDLFIMATTHVFSRLHIRDPRFDLSSAIMPVPPGARDRAAESVKGPVEALVRKFARVAPPSSLDTI
ncbi:hypothetical protein D1007_01309 [Hordeum vulgare]|nr:hypothetical protein D1007_01309 [Hordeum vulgare]